ncbi:MAG TPA: PIG-L family deacetylase [Flavisolibacter sp.]|nr:PIG-L family deacetylase [Flavisolibacter sp.]
MIKNKRILVLAPHTDDGEFGCGGTIHKLAPFNEIYYAAFSVCRISVRAGFDPNVLENEVRAATKVLGIKQENLILFDYEVRTFNYRRQEILDDILTIKKNIAPDLVLLPSKNDVHQDHFTITNEAVRAFKYSSILSYEMPWNNFSFDTSCFSTLETEHLQAKCDALSVYQSQAHKPYASHDFIRSLAKVRGVQAGHEFAEAFEVVRWII